MPYGHWHYQQCGDCPNYVLTRAINGTEVLCKKCKTERKSEQQRYRRRFCFHKDDMCVLIIYDPIPVDDGGFKSGASISIESLKLGIRFRTFMPGMEFVVKGEKKLLCNIDGEYKLVNE